MLADALAGGGVDHQRRRFLQHFLVAALQRALAFAQMHHVAVLVAQDLKFDVARTLDQFLHVDVGAAEGLLGFGARRLKQGDQLAAVAHDAHAAAAAAFGCFDHDGIADFRARFVWRCLRRERRRGCRE